MSPVYLYALLAEPPAVLPSGLAGEPLRLVSCDGVLAAVGDVEEAPALEGSSLRAHDAAVRRLADVVPALLPARFGSLAGDERQLCEAIRPRVPALRAALEAVRGCDQMTLRFSHAPRAGAAGPRNDAPGGPASGESGPGTRYLSARRDAAGDPRGLPEVARILDALAPLVRGERRERHERPPLVASVYHLVPRGSLDAYRAALTAATRAADVRVTLSGPWPPYAFAPDELAWP